MSNLEYVSIKLFLFIFYLFDKGKNELITNSNNSNLDLIIYNS